MQPVGVVRATAVARIGVGAVLALAARQAVRAMAAAEPPNPSFVLLARTVGIRDACFGLGLLRATGPGRSPGEVRRWVQAWLANEIVDVVAAIAASRQLGPSGAAAAAVVPLPLIAADVWILRHLT